MNFTPLIYNDVRFICLFPTKTTFLDFFYGMNDVEYLDKLLYLLIISRCIIYIFLII
jgi:hypothetical protein